MKDASRPGERPAVTYRPDASPYRQDRRDEPSVEEIVERCRAVAAACGLAWLHDLVREECERWAA